LVLAVQGQQQARQVAQEVILFFQPSHLVAVAAAALEIHHRPEEMAGLAAARRATVLRSQAELEIPHLQAHHKVTMAVMMLAVLVRHFKRLVAVGQVLLAQIVVLELAARVLHHHILAHR
jgi:hypothetical protein